MDIFSAKKRSEIMSLIHNKNTKPEVIVRSILHKNGYRFRLHDKSLPGRPDIILKRYDTVIFINGCFWHGHKCRKRKIPKSNKNYCKLPKCVIQYVLRGKGMTTVRLNDEIDIKLSALIELEKTTKSEIIKKAISEYYESHYQEKTPYELGEDLFGRYGSEEDLSQTYKTRLMEKLNAKHSH